MNKTEVYQILVVSGAYGLNFIVPDCYVYNSKDDALEDLAQRQAVFGQQGEILTYKGDIKGLADIEAIYKDHEELEENHMDAYIMALDVRE